MGWLIIGFILFSRGMRICLALQLTFLARPGMGFRVGRRGGLRFGVILGLLSLFTWVVSAVRFASNLRSLSLRITTFFSRISLGKQ
jgi:hypothetical protein